MSFGFMGKVLRVDLSSGRIAEEAVPAEWNRKFLGGAGVASKYLFEEVPPDARRTRHVRAKGQVCQLHLHRGQLDGVRQVDQGTQPMAEVAPAVLRRLRAQLRQGADQPGAMQGGGLMGLGHKRAVISVARGPAKVPVVGVVNGPARRLTQDFCLFFERQHLVSIGEQSY